MNPRSENEQHRRLMRLELQHRLRNSMASVRAIARRTYESSTSLDGFFEAFDARLRALGLSQALLAKAGEAGSELTELIADQLQLIGGNLQAQVSTEGPKVRLEEKAAEILSLAIHELAMNAIRYGALSDDAGRVTVCWHVDGDALLFEWREQNAVPVSSTEAYGFGRELLEEGLDYTLGGTSELQFTPRGVSFHCRVPIAGNIKSVEEN